MNRDTLVTDAGIGARRGPEGNRLRGGLEYLGKDLGMAWVLLALCVLFSALSWSEQQPGGAQAARGVADEILATHGPAARVLVAVRGQPDDVAYADALASRARAFALSQAWVVAQVVPKLSTERIRHIKRHALERSPRAMRAKVDATRAEAGSLVAAGSAAAPQLPPFARLPGRRASAG